jgi:hypothetical protein
MSDTHNDGLPAGRQPYDRLNGARIGAIVGGILAVLLVALTGLASIWWVVGGAIVGAGLGYGYQAREEHRADAHSGD